MNAHLYWSLSGMVAVALLLGGCSQGHDDLDAWIAQQRRQAVPHVTPLKKPTQYTPFAYTQGSAVDPFSSVRLTRVLKLETPHNRGDALIAKELARRKGPLEAFPLDAMTMVGTLDSTGKDVALVRVDQLLYQVRVGDYLGQHYGLVTKISADKVTLREVVQDATGDWVERPAALLLQQEKKHG